MRSLYAPEGGSDHPKGDLWWEIRPWTAALPCPGSTGSYHGAVCAGDHDLTLAGKKGTVRVENDGGGVHPVSGGVCPYVSGRETQSQKNQKKKTTGIVQKTTAHA